MMNQVANSQSHLKSDSSDIKYGERLIKEGELTTFPNPRIGRRYNINIFN